MVARGCSDIPMLKQCCMTGGNGTEEKAMEGVSRKESFAPSQQDSPQA
jgi:hypothetical protein